MSLSIGLVSTIGMLVIGIAIGVISGFFGGLLDTILMRVTEFVMLFRFNFCYRIKCRLGDKIKIHMAQL